MTVSSNPVISAITAELTRQGISINDTFRVVEFSQQLWNNSALGVEKPGEFYTQALVRGWVVVIAGNGQCWRYHTDMTGTRLQLHSQWRDGYCDEQDTTSCLNFVDGVELA